MFWSSAATGRILRLLADKYHVVLFDHLAWGLNSRPGNECSIIKGELESEKWQMEWVLKTVEALGEHLPEKFLLAGHSFGGYLVSLLASQIPERIEALFLISPVATSYNPETYNPCEHQSLEDPSKLYTKKEAEKGIKDDAAGTNFLFGFEKSSMMKSMVNDMIAKETLAESLKKKSQTKECVEAMVRYEK
jgi:pimeloyl-ACP methyl ester carboxylesterase